MRLRAARICASRYCHRLHPNNDHILDDDDTQNVGLLIMIGIAALYSIQWTVEQPLDDRIAVILSFLVFIFGRFQLSHRSKEKWSRQEIDDLLHESHSILVLLNVLHGLIFEFRSNQWISFGMFWSDLLCDLMDRRSWIKIANGAIIVTFFVIFECIGKNAVDLVFILSVLTLGMKLIRLYSHGTSSETVEFQYNLIGIHLAFWLSISDMIVATKQDGWWS